MLKRRFNFLYRLRDPLLAGILASGVVGLAMAEERDGPRGNDQGVAAAPMAGAATQRENRLRWISEHHEGGPRRAPRMSPEERQKLRRDVHDAGRELYPRRRHRRE